MGKSLRSKSKQKVKRLRRAKYQEIEKKKCWEKHFALQEKTADKPMAVDAVDAPDRSNHLPQSTGQQTEVTAQQNRPEQEQDVVMEENVPLSRTQLLKFMKRKKSQKKTKRLKGGRNIHSKW